MGKLYIPGETLFAGDLNASFSETVNVTGNFVFTGAHVWNNLEVFNGNTTINSTSFSVLANTTVNGISTFNKPVTFNNPSYFNSTLTLASNARVTSGNNYVDNIGEVRTVPIIDAGGGRSLVNSDHGKCLLSQGTITIPNGVFSAGQNVTIHNNTAATIVIAQGGGLTLYLAGTANVGNRNLLQRGICTILFVNSSYAIITGTGVS
jgi:hypothetical protein